MTLNSPLSHVATRIDRVGIRADPIAIDEADGFEEEVGGDLEGFGADLVDGVLGGVVVAVGEWLGVGAVVDVDDVEEGTPRLRKGRWSSSSWSGS